MYKMVKEEGKFETMGNVNKFYYQQFGNKTYLCLCVARKAYNAKVGNRLCIYTASRTGRLEWFIFIL